MITRRCGLLAAMALALGSSGVAMAYNPNGEALPPGSTEQAVYQFVNNQWVPVTSDGAGVLARSWNSGPTFGFCNKAYWDITFTTHASVAQWLNWTLATTRKDWRVRKPGDYASDSIDFTIQSNNAVVVSFHGFGDLQYLNPNPPQDTTHTIATWYGVGNDIANVSNWVPAADLNNMTITFPDSDALHHGQQYKIWQRIKVVESNSSSEYENVGTVRLAITNLKFWIDAQTGGWAQSQFGAPPTETYVPPTI